MGRRGGSRSSFGVLQVILGVIVLLGTGITLAFMFAPSKPPAPPTSKVTYKAESPRASKRNNDDAPAPLPDLPTRARNAAQPDAAPAEPKPEEKAKPFKITGLVIDARTRQPLDRAMVTVRRKWTPAEERDWEGRSATARLAADATEVNALRAERERLQLTERARTDEQGRFEIALDVPGVYEAEAVHRAYMRQTTQVGALATDSPVLEIQVGLSTGASISGRVTEIGSNIPAVDVRVVIEKDGIHSARTDDKGEYKITGLEPGEYGVLVNTTGSAYKPGNKVPYEKVGVRTVSDDVRNVNFEVEGAGVVWGYIRTPDNAPISGAEVLITAPESILSQVITTAIRQAPPVRGRSEQDGYYELLGVPLNEEYRVYATADSASPQLADPFVLTSEVRSVQIDVYLYGGSDVSGIVVNSQGQPVADANVACIPSYSKLLSPMDTPAAFREAKSGPDGTFTIAKLPAGDYQILGRKQGFKIPTAGTSIYPDGFSPLSNVEVRLLPIDEGRNYVAGTVTDQRTRDGIGGAKVELSGFGSETLNNFTRETNTDAKGAFSIEGLEAGMYRLRVSKEGYAPRTVPRVLLNQETSVTLDQSAVIRGVVLVKETKKPPVGEYRVLSALLNDAGQVNLFGTYESGGREGIAFANTDGSFELFLPPGAYRLEARADGYTPGRQDILAEAGKALDGIVLEVSEAGGVIAGTVTTKGGESPTGTEVILMEVGNVDANAASGGMRPQTVGDDGFFQFENLSEGAYYAIARNPLYANGTSRTVQLASGQTVDNLTIKLGSGGWIEGRVYRNGQPQAGATVIAVSIDSGSTGQAIAESDGSYRIEELGSGQYTVTWIPAGTGQLTDLNNTSSLSCTVTEGQGTRLDFGLNGVTFVGQCMPLPPLSLLPVNFALLQPVGAPLPASPGQGIRVEDLLRVPVIGSVQIQGNGSFTFEGIPEGIYQLSVYYAFGATGGPGGGDLRLVYYEPQVTLDGNTAPRQIQVSF